MRIKSHPTIPIILSHKQYENSKSLTKASSADNEHIDSDEHIFSPRKSHNKSSLKLFTSLSPTCAETRMEFFDSMKTLHNSKEKAPKSTVNTAYLNECKKKNLSPIPLGLARPTTSDFNLRHFGIGDNYAEAFAKGIKKVKNLERLNIGSNCLSPRGTHHIVSQISSHSLQELNLKSNRVDLRTTPSLLKLIQKKSSLKYLNLENTNIGDAQVVQICDALWNDRTLTFLGLALNSLGRIAAVAIKKMLIENQYLKKLDLHWNNFKDFGTMSIFEGLSKNDSLKEIDLSWNSIGENKDQSQIKKISELLPLVQGLAHLDLSCNYLTEKECEILAEGLKKNHNIYGLHLLGNDGYIDSKGFIHKSSKSLTIEQSHLTCRIFEESTSIKKKKNKPKSNCWVCENWVETTVYWHPYSSGGSPSGQIFIHFECDDYEPDIMDFSEERYEITRMLPPGENKFFFSKNYCAMKSREYDSFELQKPLYKTLSFSNNNTHLLAIHIVNKKFLSENQFDYTKYYTALPRKQSLIFEPVSIIPTEPTKWDISKSIFKDYKFLDDKLIDECLDFDWSQSRLSSWIKPHEQKDVKTVLRKYYRQIMETFRYLGSQSTTEYLAVGSNVLTDFLNHCELFDDFYQTSDFGVNWSAVKALKDERQPYNPWNALVRHEFVEILVRIAYDRYARNKLSDNVSGSLEKMFEENLKQGLFVHDSHIWRTQEYLNEEIDVVLKAHKPILNSIFKVYSGRKALPGQKPFMCLEEFRQLCCDGKLIPKDLPLREIDTCFAQAMMMQQDEIFMKKHTEMYFVEFIEAISRVSWYLNAQKNENFNDDSLEIDDSVTIEEKLDLKEKIKLAMWNLYRLCPKVVQDNFVFPSQQTYTAFMHNFDRMPTSIREMYKAEGLDNY